MFFDIDLTTQPLWSIALLTGVFLVAAFMLTLTAIVIHLDRAQRAKRVKRLEDRWEPVVFDVIAGDLEASELTKLVKPWDERAFVGYLLRLGKRVRGREREEVTKLARGYLPLIARAVTHRNAETRARAVATLGELGTDRYDAQLARALNDEALSVAFSAAHALSKQGSEKYAAQILSAIERFAGGDIRFVASMLARIGPAVAPLLRAAMRDQRRSARTRAIIAEALSRLNDLPSADVAAAILRTEQESELTISALRLLHKVGNPEHLDAVRPLIDSHNVAIRGHAVTVIAELGDSSDVGRVTNALNDDAAWVTIRAVHGLLALGEAAHVEELAASTGRQAIAAREALAEVRG